MRSIINGAGTYGEVYLAYLTEAGIDVVGFVDDDPKYIGKTVRSLPVIEGAGAGGYSGTGVQ